VTVAAPIRNPIVVPKWLLGPGVLVFVASLTAYVLTERVLGLGGTDLRIYLMGGDAFRHGQSIYEPALLGWQFTYPAFTVLIFAPLSLISAGVLLKIVAAIGIAAVATVTWLVFRMLNYRSGAGLVGATLGLTAAFIWLQPVFDTLGQGQVNIVLMLLVVADFALARHRRWPTGVLIGLATAIKLVPGLFILYLLLTRRIREAVTAIVTFVVLNLIGFLVAPSDSHRYWFGGVFADSKRVAGPDGIDSAYNQSLHGVLVRAFGIGTGNVLWYPVALVAAAAGLAVAVMAYRRGQEAAGMVLCAITALLVSPLSWHEHWVWIAPAIVLVADLSRRIIATRPILGGTLPFILWLGFTVWPERGNLPGQLIPDSPLSAVHHAWKVGRHSIFVLGASAEYPAIGLALLLGAGLLLRRIPVETAEPAALSSSEISEPAPARAAIATHG
jgi:alpha-1,2-mannosyltransferase